MWIVTGATGFIGSALVWELNEHGVKDILVVDHIPPEERPTLLRKRQFKQFIKADDLFANADKFKIEGIYHMGGVFFC